MFRSKVWIFIRVMRLKVSAILAVLCELSHFPLLHYLAVSSVYRLFESLSFLWSCKQTIAKNSWESYDLVRTARMAGYGLVVLGPTLHYWFNFMSRLLPKQDLITTFTKMAMGQIIYGPIMMVIFFSLNAFLQGKLSHIYMWNQACARKGRIFVLINTKPCSTFRLFCSGEGGSDILARLKRDFLPAMLNCVMYWPICDFITFKFFPVHLQVTNHHLTRTSSV